MNELKAYIAPTPDGTGLADYYLKSEADEYIGELKKERDWLAKDRAQAYDDLEKRAQLNIKQEESIRHQKYKRCLAMAKECVYGEIKLKRVKMRDMNNHQFWQFDNDYWQKWNNRWLELAEKFKDKEAK